MILSSLSLTRAGFLHAFTERDATAADVAARLGASALTQVKQVHGARAVLADLAEGQEADAIVARMHAGVAVAIRVADCVPILVGDVSSGDVAAIHAGWRGVVLGVVPAALERLGGREIVAAIGPCIGPCCFEVGSDVGARIAAAAPGAEVVDRAIGDKVHVDLRRAVRAQLRAAGVDDARIEDVAGCTKHEAGRFHSFRRDGANSGRLLAAIAPRSPR